MSLCWTKIAVFLIVILSFSCTQKRDVVEKTVLTPAKISVTAEKTSEEQIIELKGKKDYKKITEIYDKEKDQIMDVRALGYVMEAFFIQKNYDRTIEMGERIFNSFQNYRDSRLNLILGVAYYEKGLYEAARKNLVTAKEMGLKNRLLTYYMVDMYIKKRQYSLALTEAAELEGTEKEFVQGVIYYRDGNLIKALEKFKTAEDFKTAGLYRAYTLHKLGRHDELLELWEKGLLKEFLEAYFLVADIFLKKGEILKAKETLSEAANKYSNEEAKKQTELLNQYYLTGN